mmetsp:Transcript_140674/g.366270  ORF Transcript_140674/g.366270 Transcript_140674/m.366270 type:complete len:253 (+) Transcript_140674:654-1412(+)
MLRPHHRHREAAVRRHVAGDTRGPLLGMRITVASEHELYSPNSLAAADRPVRCGLARCHGQRGVLAVDLADQDLLGGPVGDHDRRYDPEARRRRGELPEWRGQRVARHREDAAARGRAQEALGDPRRHGHREGARGEHLPPAAEAEVHRGHVRAAAEGVGAEHRGQQSSGRRVRRRRDVRADGAVAVGDHRVPAVPPCALQRRRAQRRRAPEIETCATLRGTRRGGVRGRRRGGAVALLQSHTRLRIRLCRA